MCKNELPENMAALEGAPNFSASLPAVPPHSPALAQAPKWNITKVDSIFAIMFWVLGYVYISTFPLILLAGSFALVFTAAYAALVLVYLKLKKHEIPKESWYWLAVLLGSAVSRFLFNNAGLGALPSLFMHCAAVYWTMSAANALTQKQTSALLPLDAIRGVFVLPFIRFGAWFIGLVKLPKAFLKKDKSDKDSKAILAIFSGVGVSIIMLMIVLPQLANADAVFEGLLGSFLNFTLNMSAISNLVLAIPIAAYLFSLIYACVHTQPKREQAQAVAKSVKIVPYVTVSIVLIALSAAYLLFLTMIVLQLIPALSGALPRGITYAGYARAGFFELCSVCCITLSAMSVGFCCVKENWRSSRLLKASMLVVCAASIGLCITALARMMLYISAYGLTTLRFSTSLFMLFLILVFILIIACVFKPFNITKIGFTFFCAGYVLMLCINMEGIIASYNFKQYSSGALQDTRNAAQLYRRLSTDCLPAMNAFCKGLPDNSADKELLKKEINFLNRTYESTLAREPLGVTLCEIISSTIKS